MNAGAELKSACRKAREAENYDSILELAICLRRFIRHGGVLSRFKNDAEIVWLTDNYKKLFYGSAKFAFDDSAGGSHYSRRSALVFLAAYLLLCNAKDALLVGELLDRAQANMLSEGDTYDFVCRRSESSVVAVRSYWSDVQNAQSAIGYEIRNLKCVANGNGAVLFIVDGNGAVYKTDREFQICRGENDLSAMLVNSEGGLAFNSDSPLAECVYNEKKVISIALGSQAIYLLEDCTVIDEDGHEVMPGKRAIGVSGSFDRALIYYADGSVVGVGVPHWGRLRRLMRLMGSYNGVRSCSVVGPLSVGAVFGAGCLEGEVIVMEDGRVAYNGFDEYIGRSPRNELSKLRDVVNVRTVICGDLVFISENDRSSLRVLDPKYGGEWRNWDLGSVECSDVSDLWAIVDCEGNMYVAEVPYGEKLIRVEF